MILSIKILYQNMKKCPNHNHMISDDALRKRAAAVLPSLTHL